MNQVLARRRAAPKSSPPAAPRTPFALGINDHSIVYPSSNPLDTGLANSQTAGFTVSRQDLCVNFQKSGSPLVALSPTVGVYNSAAVTAAVDFAQACATYHIQPLIVLTVAGADTSPTGPGLTATDGGTGTQPTTPAHVGAAIVHLIQQMVAAGVTGCWFELLNEPDEDGGTTGALWYALAEAVYASAKAADSTCRVIGPAIANVNPGGSGATFLSAVYTAAGNPPTVCWDGISVHAYTYTSTNGLGADDPLTSTSALPPYFSALANLRAEARDSTPLYHTEGGWVAGGNPSGTMTPTLQSTYTMEWIENAARWGLQSLCLYAMYDDTSGEFGIVTAPGPPPTVRPVYTAIEDLGASSVNFYNPAAGAAPATLRQSQSNPTLEPGDSINFGDAAEVGNCVVVLLFTTSTTTNAATVTSPMGTFERVASAVHGGASEMETWVCMSVATAGQTEITVGGTEADVAFAAFEWSPMQQVADGGWTDGSGTAVALPVSTLGTGNVVMVLAQVATDFTATPGSPWTVWNDPNGNFTTGDGAMIAYTVATSNEIVKATWTAASGAYIATGLVLIPAP